MFSFRDYNRKIQRFSPKSPSKRNLFFAFLIGGGICLFGQWLQILYTLLGISKTDAGTCVTVTLILLSVILTAVGIYDRIAKTGGAGTLVPVTGFANAVVSPALDAGSEGRIVGVGSMIFSVAGPVILFAVLSGTLYGFLLMLFRLLGGVIG